MKRIDPDYADNGITNLMDLDQYDIDMMDEARDNAMFYDILTAVVICCATLLVVAPLFVVYWLDQPTTITRGAEDDCPYVYNGKSIRDVTGITLTNGKHAVRCEY